MRMDDEIGMYFRVTCEALAQVVACLRGLDDVACRQRPVEGGNSLLVIAKHVLANAERNVLHTFAGQPYSWQREEEFRLDQETADGVRSAHETLVTRMRAALEALPGSALDMTVVHPRLGPVPGRRVLLQAAIHAAEHEGEAKLTRALVRASTG